MRESDESIFVVNHQPIVKYNVAKIRETLVVKIEMTMLSGLRQPRARHGSLQNPDTIDDVCSAMRR
jgi:hypothetical protein